MYDLERNTGYLHIGTSHDKAEFICDAIGDWWHSKYNPIEHRLFPHLSRVCQGVILERVETLRDLMAKARTQTGLTVVATVVDKVHETGRKVADDFKQRIQIVFDEYLPQ